jgi:hypothetical protein
MNLSATMDGNTGFKLRGLCVSEQVIYWTIVLTPVWWLLGLQVIIYPTVVLGLLLANFNISKVTREPLPLCIWAWSGMCLIMLWTAIRGLDDVGFQVFKAVAALMTLYKSYFLLLASLLIPLWGKVRTQVITRATAWLASGFTVTLILQLITLFLIGRLRFLPPLATLIPGDKASLRVDFAVFQPFFGIPLPRTALYTPDPPVLGVCSILFFFICLGETDLRLRRLALLGCLAGLLVSQSRLAWVSFPIALFIMACLRNGWLRPLAFASISATAMVCSFFKLSVHDLLSKPMEIFTSARSSSSEDRAMVVQRTIEVWQEKPWLGWGIIQHTVKWHTYEIALGAFSTYPSVLYLHGILGLICFLFAQITTLGSFWGLAIRANKLHLQAFVSLLTLYFLCNGMPFTWMIVNFWFFFIWLGAILAETRSVKPFFLSWEGLSQRA